jgi:hypothetical protein
MNRAAPPVKKAPSTRPSNRGRRSKKLIGRYRLSRQNTSDYACLLAQRYASGLLNRFICYQCGEIHLDVLGWDGRRKPLCWSCAQ